MKELFKKYLEGTITSEEFDQLLTYYCDAANRSEMAELLRNEFDAYKDVDAVPAQLNQFFQELDNRTLGRVKSSMRDKSKKRFTIHRSFIRYAAAAVILLVMGWVWVMVVTEKKNGNSEYVAEPVEIAPGGNRAFLTLEDGRRIELDSAHTGIQVISNGIAYENGEQVTGLDGARQYANLQTPRGGQYNVVLPDGSRVWLNAASSLRYPLSFDRNIREVELDGEAYFEIASDESKPFIVRSHGQQVSVLGTSFNIHAYGDEARIMTTLVEGKIELESLDGGFSRIMTPGQHAVYTADGLSVAEVDPLEYVSWREGLIIFNSDNLPEILNQLERWYDVEFDTLPKGINATRVFGMIHRSVPLSDVLKTLNDNFENIQFEINGRRVTMAVY